MRHGSLFSGIGGFDLAASWMGWENVFHCEWNEFGQKTLKYYWPDAISYGDITKTNFTIHRGNIDIITGGFPCQPFSTAGKRKGTADDRHLWPEMLRAIKEISPRWIVGENVPGIVSWSNGLVFEQVQADLEAEGYEVQPVILPACAVNAPHRRDRVWFIANSTISGVNSLQKQKIKADRSKTSSNPTHIRHEHPGKSWTGRNGLEDGDQQTFPDPGRIGQEIGQEQPVGSEQLRQEWDDTDSGNPGLQGNERSGSYEPRGAESHESDSELHQIPNWERWPTQSPICGRTHGVRSIMVRNINQEIYGQISKRYTDKDLQEVWQSFQSEDVQRKIGGLYKIHEPGILLQVLQLCSTSYINKEGISAWSEKTSEKIMRKLWTYGSFANSPQGRELEKQFRNEFGDSLPYLSHEIALVTMEVERASRSFASWHRNESIKAYGNAIVPQVVYQIFKAIENIH